LRKIVLSRYGFALAGTPSSELKALITDAAPASMAAL
jgi:hypothetical protein